jgi:6-phosphogluconolactonase
VTISSAAVRGGGPRLVVGGAAEDVAAAACDLVRQAESEALARDGRFRLVLAGGSTPRLLYEKLAASPWARFDAWQVFFGDERWVAADHADSNLRMARETLLDRAAIPRRGVFAVPVDAGTPQKAAQLYAKAIARALNPLPGELPRFDLVLLGLGEDGHTASLFPGSTALEAGPRETVAATHTPKGWRVTLTAATMNAARRVLFLVSGAEKAEALARVLSAGPSSEVPAARIRPNEGELVFVVDEAAAGMLAGGSSAASVSSVS